VKAEFLYLFVMLALMVAMFVAWLIVVVVARNKYILQNDDSPRTLRRKYPMLAFVADFTGVMLLILLVLYFVMKK
jgi:hypothetical protein